MNADNPCIVVTGNPIDGFTFYGTTPMEDSVDCYRDARTRRLEEEGTDWWLAELRPLSALDPIDGDLSGPVYPADVQRESLVQHVTGRELGDSLDELVHVVASRRASDVNNRGPAAQVAFLIDSLGIEGARALLDSHT